MTEFDKPQWKIEVENAIDQYVARRRHPQLFAPLSKGGPGWQDDWFSEEFLRIRDEVGRGSTIGQLVELGLIRFYENSVYSFSFLKPEVCQWIIEEQESFEASGLKIYRPNSMNRYGWLIFNY